MAPDIIPIGPLLSSNRLGNSAGNFWPEDPTCLKWLDQQPPCSVIYVAFGCLTIFNKQQFQELALGLELSNRPFLWIVRSYSTDSRNDVYPEGFLEREGTRGKIVGWAPQQKVLSHPSVACFFSHCSWNSTMESVSNGVPFLCWPHFADQFFNESFICDVWNVGLRFNPDQNGIIKREQIKIKIEQVLGDKSVRARALNLKAVPSTLSEKVVPLPKSYNISWNGSRHSQVLRGFFNLSSRFLFLYAMLVTQKHDEKCKRKNFRGIT